MNPSSEEEPEEKERLSGLEQGGVAVLIGLLYLGRGLSVLFYEVPKTLLVELPYLVLYKAPVSMFRTLKSKQDKVNSLIRRLEEKSISLEEEKAALEQLEQLTGLYLEEKKDWLEWWTTNRDKDPDMWRGEYILQALEGLDSEEFWTRTLSVERLRKSSGKDFGYDPNDPPAVRDAARKRWWTWWEEEGRHSKKK